MKCPKTKLKIEESYPTLGNSARNQPETKNGYGSVGYNQGITITSTEDQEDGVLSPHNDILIYANIANNFNRTWKCLQHSLLPSIATDEDPRIQRSQNPAFSRLQWS